MFLRLVKDGSGFGRDGRKAGRAPSKDWTNPRAVEDALCGDVSSPGCARDGLEDVGAGLSLPSRKQDMGFEGEVVVNVNSKKSG